MEMMNMFMFYLQDQFLISNEPFHQNPEANASSIQDPRHLMQIATGACEPEQWRLETKEWGGSGEESWGMMSQSIQRTTVKVKKEKKTNT